MEEKLFKSILREAYDREYNELTARGEHKFSLRHRMRMRKVFRKYERSGVDVNKAMPKTTVRRRLTVALIVVLVAAILTVTVVALVMNGFKTVEKDDHTEVFAINLENAPTTIEEVYELTWVPEGYELVESKQGINTIRYRYNLSEDEYLVFCQYTKFSYAANENTEQLPYEYIIVDGYDGIIVTVVDLNTIVWETEKYILRLRSNLNKEEML